MHRSRVCPVRNVRVALGKVEDFHEDGVTVYAAPQYNSRCRRCNAIHFRNEFSASPCCAGGRVQLPPLPSLDRELLDLYLLPTPLARHFRHHIRQFNSSVAFASMDVNEVNLPAGGPPTFRVNGTIHHVIGPLQPHAPDQASFLQIYYLDERSRLPRRFAVVGLPGSEFDRQILGILERVIMEQNRFYHAFTSAMERSRSRGDDGQEQDSVMQMVVLDDSGNRQYDRPDADNVAVIIRSHQTVWR